MVCSFRWRPGIDHHDARKEQTCNPHAQSFEQILNEGPRLAVARRSRSMPALPNGKRRNGNKHSTRDPTRETLAKLPRAMFPHRRGTEWEFLPNNVSAGLSSAHIMIAMAMAKQILTHEPEEQIIEGN